MRHSRLVALCLLLAAALLVIPSAVVAVGARGLGPSPIRRQVAASSSSSSTSASASPSPSTSVGDAQNVTGAASGGNKSTSSYINWQLPDTFVQCQPALISFSAVFGAKDEDALGGTLKKAISNTWINLRIKPTTGDKGISEDLSSNATSWLWDKVNFPAGTNFEVLITALTNITIGGTSNSSTSSSSKGKGSSDTKHAAARRRSILLGSTKSTAANNDDDISPVVIARAFARSNVVAGTLNDTSCLSTTTPSNGTEANSFGHGGSLAGPAGNPLRGSHSKAGDRTVVIVAAFLGGLCGLFVALVGALAWHKRKDQKRLRGMAEARQGGYSHAIQMARRSGAFAMDDSSPRPTSQYAGAQNGAAAAAGGAGGAAGARSSAVPLWDGGYRDGPSAGWGYMASLVPGLAPQAPPAFTSPTSSPIDGTFAALRGRRNRNRLLPTNRRAEEGEEDLPSYGKSEAEIRDLPSYEAGFLAGLASLQQQQALQAAQHRQRGGYDASTPGVEPASYEDAAGAGAGGAPVPNPDGSFADERAGLLTTVAEESSLYDDNASNSSGSLGRSASNATSRTISTAAAAFQAPPPAEVGRNVTMGSLDRQQQHLRRNDSTSSSGSAGSSGAWRFEEQRPTLPPIQTSGQLFGRDSQDEAPPTVTTMRSPFDDDVAGGQGHSSITIMDDDGAHGGATTPTATTGYEARPLREGSDGSDGSGSMAARRRSRGGSQSQAIFDGLSALDR